MTLTDKQMTKLVYDINDVVFEFLPESRMGVGVPAHWRYGFAVEWRHSSGWLLCKLGYGAGALVLGMSVPCCKTMRLAMLQITSEYDLGFQIVLGSVDDLELRLWHYLPSEVPVSAQEEGP